MILLEHGRVFLFYCKACGCRFKEAASKTSYKNSGVWDPERKEYGTNHKCPDCGCDVLGFQIDFKKEAKGAET